MNYNYRDEKSLQRKEKKMETKKAIVRLIISIIVMINATLTAKGINPIPFDESLATEILTYLADALIVVWVWWKDAPLTQAGREGHKITKAIKEDGIEPEGGHYE